MSSRGCYRCGKPGHFARECWQVARCHSCGDRAHKARECPQRRQQARKAAQLVVPTAPAAAEAAPQDDDRVDYFFLVDTSGSMAGERLEGAKDAVSRITADHIRDHDDIAIISFGEGAFWRLKPQPAHVVRDRQKLGRALARMYAKGQTAIWDAIHMAACQVRVPERTTIVTVLTDGQDNASTHTKEQALAAVEAVPGIRLSVAHVSANGDMDYVEACRRGRGTYRRTEGTHDAVAECVVGLASMHLGRADPSSAPASPRRPHSPGPDPPSGHASEASADTDDSEE